MHERKLQTTRRLGAWRFSWCSNNREPFECEDNDNYSANKYLMLSETQDIRFIALSEGFAWIFV